MSVIKLTGVSIEGNGISCTVETEGEVSRAFKKSSFRTVYDTNLSMEDVPESIAVIPVLGTLLPISWLFDAELDVSECDVDFVNSIPGIKKGYIDMYPDIRFGGSFNVLKIVKNDTADKRKALALFSGGLDSHYTALSHSDEKPDLLILRGADISILPKDDAGWNEMLSQVDRLSGTIGSDRLSAVTDFRRYVDYRFLNTWTTDIAGEGASYWVCFQHGLGLIAHAAPFVYLKGIKKVYIASSFTEDDEGKVACASDPSIDEKIHFCGASVCHDGYSAGRSEKLKAVCRWAKEHDAELYLRVCHKRPDLGKGVKDGKNCCRCEKCFRTILSLYALKEDPSMYGFDIGDPEEYFGSMHMIVPKWLVRHFNTRYLPVIKLIQENYTEEEILDSLRWLYDFRLDEHSEFFKWVDQRIEKQHERNIAQRIEMEAAERRADKMQKKAEEYKEKYKALKKEMEGGFLHRIARKIGVKQR